MAAKAQALGLTIGAIFFSTAACAACSVSDLQWMLGSWVRVDDKGALHEHWEAGAAGELLGFVWGPNHVHPGDVIELAAIEPEGEKLVLRKRHFDGILAAASDDPITYISRSCSPQSVTFEGIGKWLGADVTYRLEGNIMVMEGDAHDNGRPGHFYTELNRK